ncbi:unnamed protein product, partial [Polarella glacialis]
MVARGPALKVRGPTEEELTQAKSFFWKVAGVVAAFILVVVGISGPVYAFTLVSCVSTRNCYVGSLLISINASCKEGTKDGRSETLLHGDTCTLQCGPGLEGSVPMLQCDDGVARGQEGLRCQLPNVPTGILPVVATLASGAVTEGSKQTACYRAQYLQCQAAPGGASILVKLPDMTKGACDDLFAECRILNPAFSFTEHVQSAVALAYAENRDNKTLRDIAALDPGTCTLGCFVELVPEDKLVAYENALFEATEAAAAMQTFPGVQNDDTGSACDVLPGPACVNVRGSCNAGDDGDYYKHPLCVTGIPQWSTVDTSRRIRYDGIAERGQSGKWLLEAGANVLESGYGEESARQPSFNPLPVFGGSIWNFKCHIRPSIDSSYIIYRNLVLELMECSCTAEQDCNGHGITVGSKVSGANCKCICEKNFAGDNCEIPLCQAPGVINALSPSCKEGPFLYPGTRCTPACRPGFLPSKPFFTCATDGSSVIGGIFECSSGGKDMASLAGNAEEYGGATTTAFPKCTEKDCLYRGRATGERRLDGSCICECLPGYSGNQCRDQLGNCTAPLTKDILNGALSTCLEGQKINKICTARCAEGYYGLPAILECQGTALVPSKFRCFGGKPVSQTWCEMMQSVTIAMSVVCFLALFTACCCFQRHSKRKWTAWFTGVQLIEQSKDDLGHFNVVRSDNRPDKHSRLPTRIMALQHEVDMLALEDAGNTSFDMPFGQQALENQPRSRLPLEESSKDPSSYRQPGSLRQLGDGSKEVWGDEVDIPRYDSKVSHPVSITSAGGFLQMQLPDAFPAGGWSSNALVPSPRLRKGREVVLSSVPGRPELDGARGWLIEFRNRTGLWQVDLEGAELLDVPESCLDEATTVAVPGIPFADREVKKLVDTAWLVKSRDLEKQIDKSRKKKQAKFAGAANQAQEARQASLLKVIEETADERDQLEDVMLQALRVGDGEGMRGAISRSNELLKDLVDAPPTVTAGFRRLLETAESRLEQHDERERTRASKREYEERVAKGDAADWKMTSKEFWRHAAECAPERVQAGLKAKLSVFLRSTDGMRSSILHHACREACTDEVGSDTARRRLEVVMLLLDAKANADAVDFKDRTALDLAIA